MCLLWSEGHGIRSHSEYNLEVVVPQVADSARPPPGTKCPRRWNAQPPSPCLPYLPIRRAPPCLQSQLMLIVPALSGREIRETIMCLVLMFCPFLMKVCTYTEKL